MSVSSVDRCALGLRPLYMRAAMALLEGKVSILSPASPVLVIHCTAAPSSMQCSCAPPLPVWYMVHVCYVLCRCVDRFSWFGGMATPCFRFLVPVTRCRPPPPPKGQRAEHYTNACGVYALWFLVLGLFWPVELTSGQSGASFWPTHTEANNMHKIVHQISQLCSVALLSFALLTVVCCGMLPSFRCRPLVGQTTIGRE